MIYIHKSEKATFDYLLKIFKRACQRAEVPRFARRSRFFFRPALIRKEEAKEKARFLKFIRNKFSVRYRNYN